jgi:hypothetical protein
MNHHQQFTECAYMPMSIDLLRKYQQIAAVSIDDQVEEVVSPLLSTEWVRILIVRDSQYPEVCSIEIEISPPHCIIDPSTTEITKKQDLALNFVGETMRHLEYLLRLKDLGFLLGVFSIEGMWSASFQVRECLDEAFFSALIPPRSPPA